MTEEEKDNRKVLERLIMFNDAVYAIALTLLVLELKLPEGVSAKNPSDMVHHLEDMTPRFMAFLLSAILVGGNWISSINIQQTLSRANNSLKIEMVIYLIIISLMPFCCNLIGTYPDNPTSYVTFGIVNLLLNINGVFFLRDCRVNNLYHADTDMVEIAKLEKVAPLISIFIIAIAASAYYSTQLSFTLFLLYNLVPVFASRSLKINHE